MSAVAESVAGGPVDRVARAVTEAGAPWVLNVVVPLVLGGAVGAPWWGLFAAAISGVVPICFIAQGVLRQRIGDHHVTERRERHGVLAFILSLLVAGLVVELVAGAPRQVVGLTAAGLATLGAIAVVTVAARWKISVHTAVSAGSALILAAALSPWWLLTLAATPAIGWSRVRLGDHTLAQVCAGAALGAAVASAVYLLTAG